MNEERYYPGKGCQCYAHSEYECACNVDWTEPEVYELRDEVKELKKWKEAIEKLFEICGLNAIEFKDIMTNKINLDVFKAQQSEIDKAQIEFNNATLDLIKDIYKTLIIGFLLLIILMLVTWGYLTYTYFNH